MRDNKCEREEGFSFVRDKKSLSFFVYFFGPCLAQKSHDVRRKPFGPQKFWRNTYDFFAKEAARDLVLPAARALVDVPYYVSSYSYRYHSSILHSSSYSYWYL